MPWHCVCCGGAQTLTNEQFFQVLKGCFPTIRESAAQLLFEAFDDDNSGSVDYKEFTLGVARLTEGSLQEKTALLFDVFGATLALLD